MQNIEQGHCRESGRIPLFTDGDCIPHPDFVRNHVKLAAANTLLSGDYFKLPLEVSRAPGKQDIVNRNCTQSGCLLKHGVAFTPKIARLLSHPVIGAIFDALTITRATWNGHNSSTWKKHILAVNGFDERIQYGEQDREFGERLMNMGIKARQVRYRCSCVHLDHGRGYARPESIARNRSIRLHTRDNHITRTEFGIDSAPAEPNGSS